MDSEIYKVIDEGDGREYLCSSKRAVVKLIASITELPTNDPAVKEAAEGGRGFQVSTEPLYK